MESFFDQWIRGIGIPDYEVTYTYRRAEGNHWVLEGSVKQRVVAGQGKLPLDGVYYCGVAPLVVLGKDKQEYRKSLLVEGPETRFQLKLPVAPADLTFNADGAILAHPTAARAAF